MRAPRFQLGPPPKVDRPLGFLFLTVGAVCIVYNAADTLAWEGSSPFQRALAALVGATALVAADALWCMRRWVVAATLATVAAVELWLVMLNVMDGDSEAAVVAVLMSMAVVGPVLAYVLKTAAKLFPSAP